MCIPAAVGIGITLVGAAMQAKGQIDAGNAAADASAYNASLARRDAEIYHAQAVDARKRGEVEEMSFRDDLSSYMGEQANSLAATGFTLDSGSPLALIADSAEAGEIDAQTIRYNAEMEAIGHENNAASALASGTIHNVQAANSKSAGRLSGATSLLSGLGSAGMSYGSYKKYGG